MCDEKRIVARRDGISLKDSGENSAADGAAIEREGGDRARDAIARGAAPSQVFTIN